MCIVTTLVCYSLVYSGYFLAGSVSLLTPLCCSCHLPLRFSQFFLLFPKELWSIYFSSIAECQQCIQSCVRSCYFFILRQWIGFYFRAKAGIPLSRSASANCKSLYITF